MATKLARKSYVCSLAAASTMSIQMQASQTIKNILLSMVTAAAGSVEISFSSASQIATAQPSSEVIARIRIGATAGNLIVDFPVNVPVAAFQYVYIHTTGAGNVGEITLFA